MPPPAPENAMKRFEDRVQAGRVLAERLRPRFGGRSDVLVLALPRGGVPIGYEVARALGVPMDVFLVRKLGVPGHEELAMGAIAGGGVRVMNPSVLSMIDVPQREIDRVARMEEVELARRAEAYRGTRVGPDVKGRTVILVDDGLATGSTMRAAAAALKALGPDAVVVAVPVAARDTCDELAEEVDEVICLHTPEPFHAVGLWYEDFSQTTDDEVRELLEAARAARPSGPSGTPASSGGDL
jgi:putative phosphoribosyl transferase